QSYEQQAELVKERKGGWRHLAREGCSDLADGQTRGRFGSICRRKFHRHGAEFRLLTAIRAGDSRASCFDRKFQMDTAAFATALGGQGIAHLNSVGREAETAGQSKLVGA